MGVIGGRRKDSAFPELMRRIGLVPEDTEFNRRAAAYAQEAADCARKATMCGMVSGNLSSMGRWIWNEDSHTWTIEAPEIEEVYSAPEQPKVDEKSEQERMWKLLEAAARGS